MSSELRRVGPCVTKVPAPWRRTTYPSSISPRTASRRVMRLTAKRLQSASSLGSLESGGNSPSDDQPPEFGADDVRKKGAAARLLHGSSLTAAISAICKG